MQKAYFVILQLQDEPQPVHAADILNACGNEVNSGGFNAGMAQHIRKLHHVPAGFVERPGKQMAQVVGEHLGGRYPRPFEDGLHLRPNLTSGQPFPGSGEEYLTRGDFLFSGVF